MIISIADCNHGFFQPEKEEAKKLGVDLKILNCSQDQMVKRCQGSDVIVVQRLKISGELIDQIPSCKVVTRYGVGLDNIDCEAMKERGIQVVNFPGFCTEEVANHALASIMFLYRRFDSLQHYGSSLIDEWGDPSVVRDIKSANKTTVGVVGVGRIGKSVISRLHACGFDVIAYDPYISDSPIQLVDNIKTVFSDSDIVTIHVPLNDETKHMINEELFALMKNGSSIVNTSRGEVVKSEDLLDALCDNIHRAFVDVWDPEPPNMGLWKHSSLHISHHCAFYSKQSLDYLKRQSIIQSVDAYNAV